MFPRLPGFPARHARLQPVVLAVVSLASLTAGFIGDNRGLMVMGGIGLAGAVIGVVSARVMVSPEPQDEENATHD